MSSLERMARAQLADQERAALAISDITEDGLALQLAEQNVRTLRYVAKWSRWMRWTGQAWREDDTLAIFDTVRAHLRRVATAAGKEQLKKSQIVANITNLMRSDRRMAATIEQWDIDDWALNTPDGIMDLRTGTMLPHDPDQYCTRITAVAPGGECPIWLRFLDEITDGDADLIAFLQRIAGYALTGSTREHALFFLYGTGRNGKGTFLNTLRWLYGDYASVSSTETFTEARNDRHPTEIADLRASRLVVASEVEEGRAWAESRIKALTGGDPIKARFMRQDFFEFTPKFTLIISGNHKPRLRNVDEAMRARLHLVPFAVTIPPERRDKMLDEKLKAEGSGILAWALHGCLDWLDEGLNPPQCVRELSDSYFTDNDAVGAWLAERCETGPGKWATPTDMWESWRSWARLSNQRPGTKAELKDQLDKHGYTQQRGNLRNRHYDGIQVRLDEYPADWAQ